MHREEEDSYLMKGKRRKLINQLAAKGAFDEQVLMAMLKIPRHRFLSKPGLENRAYDDIALQIDRDQTISQPTTVAYQSTLLKVQPNDKILEVGTGSGYQASVLAELEAQVYTLERIEELYNKSKTLLAKLGYKNIHQRMSDGFEGWPEEAPFDKIIVTAAAPNFPNKLALQLKIGGIMIIPMKLPNDKQQMFKVSRLDETEFESKGLAHARFVDMLEGTV